MDFKLSEEQQMIMDTAKKFAESELAPNAAMFEELDNRSLFLDKLKGLAELGFMGLNIDGEYGGTEAGSVAFSLAITEIAKGCASIAVTTSVNNMVAEVIQSVGNDDQKKAYLPRICSGEYPAAGFCLTENGAGSDPASMVTKAVQDGDDWILNGSKLYITSGAYAGLFVVWAVTDPEAPKGKGISCFLVEADQPGIKIGKEEEKMGQKGSATNEVHFEDCRVPQSAMLGKLNEGFKIAITELAGGRIGIASLALGLGEAALDYAIEFTKERKQFGQAIAQFQGIQWMAVDRKVELEAAKQLILKAAWLKEQGQAFGVEASMAKYYASEKANQACYVAQQMMGGAGYVKEYPVERMARDVRITTIYEGTSEIQKVIIGRDLMG